MSDADIRALALFFYFSLLDDRRAIDLAITALNLCNEKKKKYPQASNAALVVMATAETWENQKNKVSRGLPNTSIQSGWVLPKDVDLGPWREFQKNATDEELTAVIWSRILNYSDIDISIGLNLTSGTVRYRLAKAVRKLGGMTHSSQKFSMREKR